MTDRINTVLVVTPHPDDAEGGAGGTIAKWTREGKKVVLVVCTNGDKGTSDTNLKPEKLAAIREKEQLDAAEVLGLEEVVFLRFPDQNLEDCREFRLALCRQIRKHRPDLVVTIDPTPRYIQHRDHYMAGRVTLDAVFPYARDYLAFPELMEEGLEPFKVREVWLFRPQEPDTYVDIEDTFVTKVDALYCHVSQMGRPREEREAWLRERSGETGEHIGGGLAEPFKRIVIER
ncbi:MAG: PIG-L family deacetylase [Dehalococcoidia bacterium]|nr:PIG-L family deacetylase [Dehalococcoidia bacterium]